MNQNERCDIARDLMPLSVDGVCSGSSQRFLDEHVAQCLPCQRLYSRMKARMPSLQPEPSQEALALKQGLKCVGRRFRGLWIALILLACVFVVLLTIGGIQQLQWNWVSNAPLDMYDVTSCRQDAMYAMKLSGRFNEQTLKDIKCDIDVIGNTAENHTGEPEALILTYSVTYYPYQSEHILSLLSDDYLYDCILEKYKYCVENGKLYQIDHTEGFTSVDGKPLLVLHPGLPVSKILFTDGKNTETIYTWGDYIPNYGTDLLSPNSLPTSGLLSPSDYERLKNVIK